MITFTKRDAVAKMRYLLVTKAATQVGIVVETHEPLALVDLLLKTLGGHVLSVDPTTGRILFVVPDVYDPRVY